MTGMTNDQYYAIQAKAQADARQGLPPSGQYQHNGAANTHYNNTFHQTKK